MAVYERTHTFPIIAGAAVRRQVRRRLLEAGLDFTEEKGFLSSLILVTDLTASEYNALVDWGRKISG